MNILDFYKLVNETTFQLDWNESEQDIICFSHLFHFDTLTNGIKDYLNYLDESIFKVEIRHDYFVFQLRGICEYYEINITDLAKHLSIDNRY